MLGQGLRIEGEMMTEQEFGEKAAQAGGRAYIVGGWVRDYLMGGHPHDKDYVVTGFNSETFQQVFPESWQVGRSFPVFIVNIDNEHREVAMARRERKIGTGYHGFVAESDADISIEEDLYRRDLTVNSIAMDVLTRELVDPYHGQEDIREGILQPVSEHFCEDPVRALRAARFQAKLGFVPSRRLIEYMKACEPELRQEPGERIFGELRRVLEYANPAAYFRMLNMAGLLKSIYPELFAMIGKEQPVEYHPEGDAFEHTMLMLSRVSERTDNIVARFCALCHDLGKGETPESMLPHHYGHEVKGLEVLSHWNQRMTMPASWLKAAKYVISEHMRAPRLSKPGKISQLLMSMNAISRELPVEDFKIIVAADHHSLPLYLQYAQDGINRLKTVTGREAPANLHGVAVGQWLCQQRAKICHEWLQEIGFMQREDKVAQ